MRIFRLRARPADPAGSVFVVALIMLVVMFLLGLGLMNLAFARQRITVFERDAAVALNLAEAGVQFTLEQLMRDPSWNGPTGRQLPLGTFKVTLAGQKPQWIVISVGQYRQTIRRLRVVISQGQTAAFTRAAFADQNLELWGTGRTDSYNSLEGPYPGEAFAGSNGDVGSNFYIDLRGNLEVWGDARSRGDIDLTGQALIYGDAQAGGTVNDPTAVQGASSSNDPPPYQYLPEVDFGDSATINDNPLLKTQPGWKKWYDEGAQALSLKAKHTAILRGPPHAGTTGIYYFSSISVVGQGEIVVEGQVSIFCTGSIDLAGNGIINTSQIPGNLIIQSTGPDLKIAGGGDLHGVVYAPQTAIDIQGGGSLYGSIVGQTIHWGGTGSFHYDEALGSRTVPGGLGGLQSWEEL